jgi:hypothetical protein
MSEFWESSLGEITGSAADAFAKSFTQIPDNTLAIARIDSFIKAEYQGNKYLSIDWILTDGDFKGSKVNQKLKVYGDPMSKDSDKTRHRALNMLKLMYQLYSIKPSHSGEPTDKDLHVFVGKTAGIKIRETEPNSEGKQYNWVSEIHEAKGFVCETGVSMVVTHTNVNHTNEGLETAFSRNSSKKSDVEDDIPF